MFARPSPRSSPSLLLAFLPRQLIAPGIPPSRLARPLTAERPRPHTPEAAARFRRPRLAASLRGDAPIVKGLSAASPAGFTYGLKS